MKGSLHPQVSSAVTVEKRLAVRGPSQSKAAPPKPMAMPIALKTVQVAAASTISCAPFAPLTMDAQTPGPALIVVAVFAIKLHVLASLDYS